MKVKKLRSGEEWRTNSTETVLYFQQICREHGSNATWLPTTGMLVTTHIDEASKQFPYEQWLQEAQDKAKS